MTLKKKLVLLLIVSGGTLILLFYIAFHATIRPSIEDQKLIFIETLKKKIHIALSIEEKNIAIHCANWANWESMKNYVETPSREFETEVFPDMIFQEDIIDVVLVVKIARDFSQEEILYYNGYKDRTFLDFNNMKITGEVLKIKENIKEKPEASRYILNSGTGPLMVVAHPIITNKKSGTLSGVLVLGRFIDRKMLEKISLYTLEEIKSYSSSPQKVEDFFNRQMNGKDLYYQENGEKLTIFYLLEDIHQRPAVLLYTQADNRLFRVVNQHFLTFMASNVLSIIFLGLLFYFSIHKYIILRMLDISNTMSKIESLADLSNRITEDKQQDEISHLISSINVMLDKLENEKVKRENAEKTMITQGKLVSIGRLASCIGHEVNNPLLAISNSIQVIKKIGRGKSPLYKEALEICESEIERIRELISSLLDFHRLEKDEFTYLEVNEIIMKSLEVLKWSKKLGATKILSPMGQKSFVYGSPAKLKQVFINFILNAVEAMDSEGKKPEPEGPGSKLGGKKTPETNGTLQIEVKPNPEKNVVEVHFIDDGPGIPEEVKGHLFEPFVSTKEAKGVGLGLYLSYKIIDHHNGEIIFNDNYKNGTHFIIKLPALKEVWK